MENSSESYALMDVPNGSLSDISHATRQRPQSLSHFSSPFNAPRQNLYKIILGICTICVITCILIVIGLAIIMSSNRQEIVIEGESESSTESSSSSQYSNANTVQSQDSWSQTTVRKTRVKPGVLIFGEEFDRLDTLNWGHILGVSEKRFNFYVNTRNNSFVRDGKLFIKPTYVSEKYGEGFLYNGTLLLGARLDERCLAGDHVLCWKDTGHPENIIHPILSSMISTEDSFSFKYGVMEIRAKMPGGDWTEPMITLQPKDEFYGSALRSGQIHLVDMRGNRKLFQKDTNATLGSEKNCPDIRVGNAFLSEPIFSCQITLPDQGFDRDFHLYQLEWTPDWIKIKVDGVELVQAPHPHKSFYDILASNAHSRVVENPWKDSPNQRIAPFDKEFYLVFAVGVGGTGGFFADDFIGPYKKPWRNTDPKAALSFWENRSTWEPSWENDESALQIDYIRIWSLNSTEQM